MKFGKKFFKKSTSTKSTKVVVDPIPIQPVEEPVKLVEEPIKSKTLTGSLGVGFFDQDGVVQSLQQNNGADVRCMKRLETFSTVHTSSTTSDSSSLSSLPEDGFQLDSDDEEDQSNDNDCCYYSSWSNDKLEQELEEAVRWEKHVLVARYLGEMDRRGMKLADPERQEKLKANCQLIQDIVDSHGADAMQTGWTKKGLMHGKHRDTMVYHKTNEKGELTVRCETPIQASLVAPLLAIVNETDLYTSWCPSFQRPFKLGVTDTGKLMQCSLANQIAYAKVDMPWPMNNREVIAKAVMAEAVDEIGALVIRAKSMAEGEEIEGLTVPPCQPGWERIQLDAGLLLQKCPEDHPCYQRHLKAKNKKRNQQNEEDDEPMMLATFTLFVTPSINCILKVVAGPMWSALIGFAEDVKHGKKGAEHTQRIAENQEVYGWVNEMVQRMADKCA